jgi:hypothetical protein
VDISIAYQGGGAKLFDLLAAVAAARELEAKHDEFRVYRVCGSSAGAVAAAVHALDGDIEQLISKSSQLDRLICRRFPLKRTRLLKVLSRLLFGQPVFDEGAVHETLLSLFKEAGIDANQTIEQLMAGRAMQLRIISSDILGLSKPVHSETSPVPLIEALVDSCAIPFAFRMPVKGTAKGNILDGGLFQNLPAREALASLPPGARALGISFTAPSRASVEGMDFLRYGAAVVDSMIAERVEDAASRLGPANVVKLTTETGTFDFQTLFKGEVRARFKAKQADARKLLSDWFDLSRHRSTPDWFSLEAHDILELEYINSEKTRDFFEKACPQAWHADEARHEVFAQSLLDPDRPDIYTTTLRLSGSKNPGLQFFRFRFYAPDGQQLLEPSVRVEDAKGQPLHCLIIPMRERGGLRARSVLIGLAKPLEASDTITLIKRERSCGAMRRYQRENWTEETLALGRDRSADLLSISVIFPSDHLPRIWRDADVGDAREKKKLDEEAGGIQLASEHTRIDDPARDLVTITSSTTAASGPAVVPRFLMVFYYR